MRSYARYLTDCFFRWKHKTLFARECNAPFTRLSRSGNEYSSFSTQGFNSFQRKENINQLLYIKKINIGINNICKLGCSNMREAFSRIKFQRGGSNIKTKANSNEKSLDVREIKLRGVQLMFKHLRRRAAGILKRWKVKCGKPNPFTAMMVRKTV